MIFILPGDGDNSLPPAIFTKNKVEHKTNIHYLINKILHKSHKMNKIYININNYEYFFKKVLTRGNSCANITIVQGTIY